MCRQPEPSPVELLTQALHNPLPVPMMGSALYNWMRALPDHFPLWSFQPFAFYNLQDTGLPTTFPLQVFINSIAEDDDLPTDTPGPVDPPVATADRRRGWLAGTAAVGPSWSDRAEWIYEEDEPVSLAPGPQPQLLRAPELFDPGSESRYHFDPPHHLGEEVGRTISELVDRREQARASGDDEALADATLDLERYLREIGVDTGPGRPREGPAPRVVQGLHREAQALLELCWQVCPFELADRPAEILAACDQPELDPRLWAVALALPVLSTLEVRVVAQEIRAAADWGDRPGRPTPRRIAVALLSHRLEMDQAALARRIWAGGGAVEEFQRARDPFQEAR